MIKKWEKDVIDLGVVKTHSRHTITFRCLEDLEDFTGITPSCNCASANRVNNDIVVVYKTGDIPQHINSPYKINKEITVHYKDGQSDVLTFRGTVTK